MSNSTNIPTGLNITTQIPLDVKEYSLNESVLSNLGLNNNLAFTYYDGMRVFCQNERTIWEWREVQTGEENTGLLNDDFTYPDNHIVFDIDYSLKVFNFFLVQSITTDDIPVISSPNNSVTVTYVTPTTIHLTVSGSETKINAGQNITITGNGTTATPYVITSNFYIQAGTNVTITGDGTSGNPLIINSSIPTTDLYGDTKEIVCDAAYLSANFNMTPGPTMGLGKNLRLGWAIMNGNNLTPDDNGKVTIAYGTNYTTLEATGGEKDHSLTLEEMPKHRHDILSTEDVTGNGDLNTSGYAAPGAILCTNNTETTGGETSGILGSSKPHNNMQPYIVRLRIMKI
jgi:hypothetical protein